MSPSTGNLAGVKSRHKAFLRPGSPMHDFRISMMLLADILPTEQVNAEHVASVAHEIGISGFWTHPVLVEERVNALMDGHHRYAAARELGLDCLPVIRLSYDDSRVRLDAWRPDEHYTPEQVRSVAQSGALLAFKSTRHVFDTPLPRCRVALERLRDRTSNGAAVEPAIAQPSRAQLLISHYHELGRRIGIRTLAAEDVEVETAQTLAPHPRLRQMLQNDPAMAALLPAVSGRVGLGDVQGGPFLLKSSDLLLVPPTLLENPAALSIAARWGLETLQARLLGSLDARRLTALLRHGSSLIARAPEYARSLLLDTLPERIAAELWSDRGRHPSHELICWQAALVEDLPCPEPLDSVPDQIELERPLEEILVSGGDTRLDLDPVTGFNRYGVPPRPRPEAVHFSSSTASAVSDYGFMFCDLLRRDLLSAQLQERHGVLELRQRTSDAIAGELLSLLGLGADEADVAITASGTDTELVSVMLTLAHAAARSVTNILISPEETGRGVKIAGAGCYYDEMTSYGEQVTKGQPIWPAASIEVEEIALRDHRRNAKSMEEIDREFLEIGGRSLEAGSFILAHVLATSKTGLSAPSLDAVDALVRKAPDRVDVVVDACQMRWEFSALGELVRRGWCVQVSGSKFLTGPPFSGALLVPLAFRERADVAAELLKADPGTGNAADWSGWWSAKLEQGSPGFVPGYGPVFRWLPALMEARLLEKLPMELRRHAFHRFREVLTRRITDSDYLELIDVAEHGQEDLGDQAFARLSIVSFRVLGRDWTQQRRALDEPACRAIFEFLNIDVSDRLGALTPTERSIASLQAHIGQPVALQVDGQAQTVMRMVLGARFFSIVGHAGPGAVAAALESEISDALRAISKLELLARRWWRLSPSATPVGNSQTGESR